MILGILPLGSQSVNEAWSNHGRLNAVLSRAVCVAVWWRNGIIRTPHQRPLIRATVLLQVHRKPSIQRKRIHPTNYNSLRKSMNRCCNIITLNDLMYWSRWPPARCLRWAFMMRSGSRCLQRHLLMRWHTVSMIFTSSQVFIRSLDQNAWWKYSQCNRNV